MSLLQVCALVSMAAILSLVPTIFLRVAGKLITKRVVHFGLALALTLGCLLLAVGIMTAVAKIAGEGAAISALALVGALVLLPSLVYGHFLKSDEGRAIGFVSGFLVTLLQEVSMFIAVAAIFFAVKTIRHG